MVQILMSCYRHSSQLCSGRLFLASVVILCTVSVWYYKGTTGHTIGAGYMDEPHEMQPKRQSVTLPTKRKTNTQDLGRDTTVSVSVVKPLKMQSRRQTVVLPTKWETNTNGTNGKPEGKQGKMIYDEDILFERAQHFHNSLYLYKTADQCMPRFPKCIIIGVMKCGTRELIDFMASHPNIVIKRKPLYELNYFLQMEKSLDWYRRQMPCSYPDQITVTKSPLYFTYEDVPEHLYKYNETLKMILLVRDPIERLLSDISFHFFFHNSKEKEQNLSKLPELDDQLVDPKTGRVKEMSKTIQLSTYDIPMKRYLRYFSREQILIIETNEFRNNPAKVLNKVETFLGLKHFITEDMFVYNPEKHYYCLRMQEGSMACYGTNRGRASQKPLRENTLKILRKYFDKHNEAFFELINERYDWS